MRFAGKTVLFSLLLCLLYGGGASAQELQMIPSPFAPPGSSTSSGSNSGATTGTTMPPAQGTTQVGTVTMPTVTIPVFPLPTTTPAPTTSQSPPTGTTQAPAAYPTPGQTLPVGMVPPPQATPPGGQPAGVPTTSGQPTAAGVTQPGTTVPPYTTGQPVPGAPALAPSAIPPFQGTISGQAGMPSAQQVPGVPLEALSPFEQYVSGKSQSTPSSISFDIKQFGYDLFINTNSPLITGAPVVNPQNPSSASALQGMAGQALSGQGSPLSTQFGMAVQNVPVNPQYLLGPSDEIRVTVWGSVEGTWDVFVDRDGTISLPKVGVLGVAGLTFEQAKDMLKKEFAKYYTDFQMNVSMGSLKTIRVYVVGNARNSGAYLVSSMSTIINGLLAGGGTEQGGFHEKHRSEAKR